MIGLRTGLKTALRTGLAVGITADELSNGGGAPVIVSIDVTPDAPNVNDGATLQLTATATWSDATTTDVTATATWASANPAAVTVNATGLVTGVAQGTSNVTATVGAIVGGEVVTSVPVLQSITVTPANPTWRPTASSDRQQFTATGNYSSGPTQDLTTLVTWASVTPATATISNAGGSQGQATAVTAYNGTNGNAATTSITATLGAVVGSTTLSVDTDRDATSGIRVPSNLYQCQLITVALGIPDPTNGRRFNEASGSLLDFIGSKVLLSNGANQPNYNVAIAGWSRPGISMSGLTTQRFLLTTYGDSTLNSQIVLAYVGFNAATGASQQIMTWGNSDDMSVTSGAASQQTFRVRENANIQQMTQTYSGGLFPLILKHDIVNSITAIISDKEILTPTYGPTSGSNMCYGALSGLAASVVYGYALEWFNQIISNADLKRLQIALGWTITW